MNKSKLLYTSLFFAACSNSNVQPSDLTQRMEGKVMIFELNGKPFTGTASLDHEACNEFRKKRTPTECKPGLPMFKSELKDGKRLHSTIWYRNGQKKVETSYLNGLEHGLVISWNDDGAKLSETSYNKGLKKAETWWISGKKTHEWEYNSAGQTKVKLQWHENGYKKLEERYDAGKNVSRKEWDEEGKLKP